MIADKHFLIWLHKRLQHIHNEDPCFDYMHKLRAIIKNTPKEQVSKIVNTDNSLEEMLKNEHP